MSVHEHVIHVASHLKVLKTKDVQDSNRLEIIFALYLLINSHDDP